MCVRIRNCMTFQSTCHLSMIHIFWTCHYSFIFQTAYFDYDFFFFSFFLLVKIEILMWWFLTYYEWNLTLNCQKRLMWWCMTMVLWIACNWSIWILLVFMFRCTVHLLFENVIRNNDENIGDTDIIGPSIYRYFFIDILGDISINWRLDNIRYEYDEMCMYIIYDENPQNKYN